MVLMAFSAKAMNNMARILLDYLIFWFPRSHNKRYSQERTMVINDMAWKIFFTVTLCLALPVIGHADWQYTRWGMTAKEVRVAATGKAVEDLDSGHNTDTSAALLKAPFASGKFVFAAIFLFDKTSRRLNAVQLDLSNPTICNDLLGSLRDKYGKPETENMDQIFSLVTWRDVKNNNGVSWVKVGERSCWIQYHPLVSPNSSNL